MNDIAPGPGHNQPPTDLDILTADAKPISDRAIALIESVNQSHIENDETAREVVTLGGMLKDLRDRADTARKKAAEPYDEGKANVQRVYARGILDPLDAAIAACRKMLDAWRSRLAAEAAAEQRKRDAEAAEARRVAEEAMARVATLQTDGDNSAALNEEIRAMQAAERAQTLESGEGAIRPGEIIRSQAGSAAAAKIVSGKIDNIGLCLAWLIRHDSQWLSETLQPRVDRHIRSGLGVDGVSRVETSSTRFRR